MPQRLQEVDFPNCPFSSSCFSLHRRHIGSCWATYKAVCVSCNLFLRDASFSFYYDKNLSSSPQIQHFELYLIQFYSICVLLSVDLDQIISSMSKPDARDSKLTLSCVIPDSVTVFSHQALPILTSHLP